MIAKKKISNTFLQSNEKIEYLKNGWLKIPKLISRKQVENLKKNVDNFLKKNNKNYDKKNIIHN